MPSLFTRILDGELPGRFVWKDEVCFAILTVNPIRPGHVLVIPRQEIDDWLDLPDAGRDHLMATAQVIGRAVKSVFQSVKVGVAIVGLEVRHVHLHLIPISAPEHMEFARADKSPDPAALDDAAERLRAALTSMGFTQAAR
jgi:histidine triad (HIT) family protein